MNPVGLYLSVREREGRLYPDDVVAHLPEIPADHPLAKEWGYRADTCSRLVNYIVQKQVALTVLDLGCGNGWLSARIGRLPGIRLWGLDRNLYELSQAARVFKSNTLQFIAADVFNTPLRYSSFDIIILVSVIQYFPDLTGLLQNLKPLLRPSGEIHILDSPLYAQDELDAARQRTRYYYEALGFPAMAEQYFHHSITALDGFEPRWLYRPDSLQARLARRIGREVSPFPWFCVSYENLHAF